MSRSTRAKMNGGRLSCGPAVNRFSDCARIEITAVMETDADLHLKLEAAFSDMWMKKLVPRRLRPGELWRFNFALRRVELELLLENLQSPPEKRHLKKVLMDSSRRVKRSLTEEVSQQRAQKGGFGISAGISEKGPKAESNFSIGSSREAGKAYKSTDEYYLPATEIESKGGSLRPKWVFRATGRGTVLRGGLTKPLAVLEVVGSPAKAVARLSTSYKSIEVLEVDGPKFDSLSARKRKIILLKIRRWLYEQSDAFISRTEVQYEER